MGHLNGHGRRHRHLRFHGKPGCNRLHWPDAMSLAVACLQRFHRRIHPQGWAAVPPSAHGVAMPFVAARRRRRRNPSHLAGGADKHQALSAAIAKMAPQEKTVATD